MRAGMVRAMRTLLLVAAIAAASPALAAEGVPAKGDGTITVLGGGRAIPAGDYPTETHQSHAIVHPGVLVGFGYQVDDELHGGIQLGYMPDQYGSGDTALSVKSYEVLLELDTALARGSWYTLYAGGGIGYSLNSASRGSGATVEANSTAGFVALGLRAKLAEHFAFVVEDRYTLSSANLDPNATSSVNVGGNFLGVGLQLHFFSSDDDKPPRD
jgi:opacity protein-like surface antigen